MYYTKKAVNPYSKSNPFHHKCTIQGTAMYAEIPKDEVTRLGEQIRIDKVYQIEKFQVRNARPTYMPFPAQLMVQLGCYTEVTVVPDPPNGFPKYIYNITPFQAIKVTDGPPSLYTGSLLQPYTKKLNLPSHLQNICMSCLQMSLVTLQRSVQSQPELLEAKMLQVFFAKS